MNDTPETPVNSTDGNQPSTLEISDLNTFVRLLTGWHEHKVSILEHMVQIPEGTEAVDDGGEPLVLEGAALKGFKLGLKVALIELGELPFLVYVDKDESQEEKPAPALDS